MTESHRNSFWTGSRINWPEVRRLFVEGTEVPDAAGRMHYPTLEEVAAAVGCNVTTVKRRSTAGKWVQERERYQERLADARQSETAVQAARRGAQIDTAALSTASAAISLVERHLAAAVRHMEAGGPGQVPDLDGLELSRLGNATESFLRVARAASGESNENVETSLGRARAELSAAERGLLARAPELSDMLDAALRDA